MTAPTPHRTPRRPRIAARDRLWAGSWDVVVTGPLALPPLERLRAAAARLVAAAPHLHLGDLVVDGRWAPRPGTPEEVAAALVVEDDGPGPDATGLGPFAQRAAARRAGSAPVLWVVCGDWLALVVDHAVGDAATVSRLSADLVGTALTGAPPPAPPPAVRAPLARALLHTYGRRPARALETVRAARAARAAGAVEGPPRPVPAEPPTAVHAATSPEAAEALRGWLRTTGAGRSAVAVQALLASRALAAAGVEVDDQLLVLFDVRAHLPARTAVRGNFVAGLRLAVPRPWTLEGVDGAVRAASASGRPLSALTAGLVGQALPRRSGPGSADAAAHGDAGTSAGRAPLRPLLVVTGAGRSPEVEALPWRSDGPESVFAALNLPAPGSVTLAGTFLHGRRQQTLSFYPSEVDAGAAQHALALLARDPLPLLDGVPGAPA